MDDQNKNLILATVLSFLVILGWFVGGPMLFPSWFPAETTTDAGLTALPSDGTSPSAATGTATEAQPGEALATTPAAEAPRLMVDTAKLSGSISMRGGRFDDLSLKTYRETVDPTSPEVQLLSAIGEAAPYYAVFAFRAGTGLDAADVPGFDTVWQATSGKLDADNPVTLTWANTKGLQFTRTVAIDDNFMFTITDTVENKGAVVANMAPIGVIARHGLPALQGIYVVHEGMVRRTDGILEEAGYSSLTDLPDLEGAKGEVIEAATDGWIGFTDHYWMTTLVPEQGKAFAAVSKYTPGADIYQVEVRQPLMSVAPGTAATTSIQFFAGAKEWETIHAYQNDPAWLDYILGDRIDTTRPQIAGFIDSIDWGWFFFLTKPIFRLLHWLHGLIGNMGLAIIALTFILKTLVLPLVYKSSVSMARMKELQPEMEVIKERCGDDKQKMQREMMALYKDKKVNPAAGCLPILPQIPIFFSLYKVIYVTIELRQAPFFGWLNDLSMPDTSSLMNLFGLLPWAGPEPHSLMATIFIGVLPILLGISMWFQQKLNPAPADPVQQQIFAWMPWVFMFMLGGFSSGLVLYWITNNTITFAQQYLIMWSHGKRPDLFGNIFAAKPAKPTAANLPTKPKKKMSESLTFTLAPTPEEDAREVGRLLFAGPVDFLKGVVAMSGLPPADRLEVCFAGRSNVGKSSLINALTNRKNLARASNTPGRTQEINFFLLGEERYLVDLPGYGYAEAPLHIVAKWQALLKSYLAGRANLRRAFVLVDSRHGIKDVDEEILKLLDRSAVTFQVVLTKVDKISQAEKLAVIEQVKGALAKHVAAYPEIIVTSSEKGEGIETLRAIIATLE